MGERQHDPDRDRTFVRALQGKYSLKEELTRLRAMPRVIKGKDLKLDGGPQHFSRHYVEPEDGRTQTLHIHLEEYAPGGTTQKHGHVNEAAFYILDGAGYEIHDGQRYDWGPGDFVFVHTDSVHRHFNPYDEKAVALVVKAKCTWMFMGLLQQGKGDRRIDEQRFGAFTVRSHGTRVVVTPDVFGGAAIPFSIEARVVPNHRFETDDELRRALRAASTAILRGDAAGQG